MSKLATPKPASAIHSDMSHVIDDVPSAMHDTYDDTTSVLDNTVPLAEFLDEQLAMVRENEITKTDDIIKIGDYDSTLKNGCDPLYLWVIKTFSSAVAGEHSSIC